MKRGTAQSNRQKFLLAFALVKMKPLVEQREKTHNAMTHNRLL